MRKVKMSNLPASDQLIAAPSSTGMKVAVRKGSRVAFIQIARRLKFIIVYVYILYAILGKHSYGSVYHGRRPAKIRLCMSVSNHGSFHNLGNQACLAPPAILRLWL